jgi:hypothetical protein
VAVNFLPLNALNQQLLGILGISLFIAIVILGIVLLVWWTISGAIAFWRKPPPRLNGWQRIGIVASICWALGAWVYTASSENWAQRDFMACLERIEPGGSTRCVEEAKHARPIADAQQRQRAIINALVPPPLGWLFAYGALGIVGWIREGFSSAAGAQQ